jgi:hypothetical protein
LQVVDTTRNKKSINNTSSFTLKNKGKNKSSVLKQNKSVEKDSPDKSKAKGLAAKNNAGGNKKALKNTTKPQANKN